MSSGPSAAAQALKGKNLDAKDLQTAFTADIDKRLAEIQVQLDEAEEALRPIKQEHAVLTDMRERISGKTKRARSSNGGTRAAHGQRLPEFIGLVHEHPGITISALAEKMNVQPNYLYRLRNQAIEQNAVRRDGSGLVPVA